MKVAWLVSHLQRPIPYFRAMVEDIAATENGFLGVQSENDG